MQLNIYNAKKQNKFLNSFQYKKSCMTEDIVMVGSYVETNVVTAEK